MKTCSTCGEIKPVSEFYPVKGKNGPRPGSYCRACNTIRCHKWLEDNRDKRNAYHRAYMAEPVNNKRRRANRLKRDAASPRAVMQITLSHGLERRPTANPATIDDLMEMWANQNGCCALSGIAMTWNQGRTLPTSISLDRIDPSGGYSKDNLRLLCMAVNAFKHKMSDDEMFTMALALIGHMKRPKLRLVS